MPALRPLTCLRAASRASHNLSQLTAPRAAFSTTQRVRGGHGPQYDPPTGWLWGVRPGEKYEKEGWEDIFFYGFYGSCILFAIAYAFKPDTRCVYLSLRAILCTFPVFLFCRWGPEDWFGWLVAGLLRKVLWNWTA